MVRKGKDIFLDNQNEERGERREEFKFLAKFYEISRFLFLILDS
jgi:hypothetical protein